MEDEGFFVTLPSNSSAGFYPNNSIPNFRTKLAKPLHFTKPFEVGLIEIQYPKTWTSFPSKDAEFQVFDKKTKIKKRITATAGFYMTIRELVMEINKCLFTNWMAHIKLQYDSVKNKVSISLIRNTVLTFH